LGLFGKIEGGEVQNLGIENAQISGGDDSEYLGGLCGWNREGTIENCYATGSVSGGINSDTLGGLCGRNYGGSIENCYATGSVSGGGDSEYLGGLCGRNVDATITNCYATGSVSGDERLGGLCGGNGGSILSCFWDTETTGIDTSAGGRPKTTAQMKSAATFAGWNDGSWAIDEGNDYPRLAWENDGGAVITTDYPAKTYSGEGTQENPFRISDAKDLLCLSNRPPDWDKYFVLINDIDMVGEIYYPITTFNGSFDGSSFKIFNLEINSENIGLRSQLGLFGKIDGGEVRNLGVENAQIAGGEDSWYLAGLCSYNRYATIKNCYAEGSVSGGNNSRFIGGLCGRNGYEGTITNCYATGTVSGGDDSWGLGGLCGYNSGTIKNCYESGSVSGSNSYRVYSGLGGLCGRNSGTITNCYATGSVSGEISLGGLCGRNWGKIENCYSTGEVAAGNNADYLGGLCGSNDGTVMNCFWDKESSGMDTSDGGTGLTTAEMQNPENFEDAGWILADYNTGQTGWCIEQGSYPILYWQHDEPNTGIIPDIYGMSLEEAEAAIENEGFESVNAVYVNSLTEPEGKVISANGIAGGKVYLSKPLKIYVSTGTAGEGTAENPYYISSISDLEAVNNDLDASYILECNIDLSGRTYEQAVIAPDTGTPLRGSFNGAGYKILNLYIETSLDYLGLFGKIDNGEVRNLGIENVQITGSSKCVGGLCGMNKGTITNCYATGSVSGGWDSNDLGGLCGRNIGTIENCYATGSVSGGWYLGGLCGKNDYGGTIKNCYSTGSVSGDENSLYLGGLCGRNSGAIENCYAT
ncbi:GLUG motif-containing protein, partial [Sedimentisphaera salicampi]|uniref:GLUG motif-containing protein n=1 Tax=Sedimentisphaera salicampi TaxID=1941349 RepID=UPI000E445F7E